MPWRLQYYYYHDRVVERAAWPTKPTKIYALFKEKVSVTLDEKGEAIFSSNDNLKLQDNSDLKAYVVYKVVNGKGMLNKLVQVTSDGMKTYNALLCQIFGFYPESEILYMYGNYEYGQGFYKARNNYEPTSDYLTVAIAGGTPPTFFTLDTSVTGQATNEYSTYRAATWVRTSTRSPTASTSRMERNV